MRKMTYVKWLFAVAATMGLASSATAQDVLPLNMADDVLNAPQPSLIRQIDCECPTVCDDIACDIDCLGCDSCDGCGSGCGLGGFDLGSKLFGDDSAIDVGGWMQFGYTSASTGLFNSDPDKFNAHQLWLYTEKVADGSNGFDWGFRFDMMYGTDAGDTQSFGNNNGNWDFDGADPGFWANHGIYGWAIPQLYAEVAMGDLSIKAGHFYTLLGYEVVTAPDNFFFSHAFTMYNSEAFTHTGVLATYNVSDNVTAYGGWTLGWDTGFDQNNQGNSFLGGTSVGLGDDLTVTYILTAGNLGANGEGYTHSIVADYAVTEKLNYVVQSDLVNFTDTDTDTIGLNQYLIYSINDMIGVGGRYEWWKTNGSSVNALTAGVNVKPTDNLILRPEVRHQWTSDANPAGLPVAEDTIFGIDAILTF